MVKEFPWMNESLSDKERAEKLVESMNLDQKISQLHGGMRTIDIYNVDMEAMEDLSEEEYEEQMEQLRVERHVKGLDELGIPRMRVTNGPVGVGMGDGYPSPAATALPMAIGVAASFNRDLAYEYGNIVGSETKTLGQHVLEGPGVGLHRTPIAGRNFEYFSEDPYLSGIMGVQVTNAIQDNDVIAMGKHYVVNDQEYERFRTSVEVDEHVLRELYLLPFEMLVKDGKIASIMSAYNRIRGTYATENYYTLNRILRKEWGFEGYVQSDFWSARSSAPSMNAGLDLEMPDAKWFNEETIKSALDENSLEIETVDRALVRRFTQMFRFNQFGEEYNPGEIDAKAHGEKARKIGSESAILLKNDKNILPLDPKETEDVLIVGQSKFAEFACNGGGGSSKVTPLYTVDPLEGMEDVLGELNPQAKVSKFIVKDDLSNLDEALSKVEAADKVVIMAGIVASEGYDLKSPVLPNQQNELIEKLLGVDDEAVVVLKDSTPVFMPWIDKASTVLETWNQGTEDGHVVADLVFGQVNPSGKVPTTYAEKQEDLLHYDHQERHPGIDEGDGYPVIHYSEKLNMGYRWYQSQNIKPLFEFGYGLSYTSFVIKDVDLKQSGNDKESPIQITASVTNTGKRAGAEVVQVYAGIPSEGQPPKRLVGFQKIDVQAGETETVEITIDPKATNHPLSSWDYAQNDFAIKDGEYTFYVGNSSENTTETFTLEFE